MSRHEFTFIVLIIFLGKFFRHFLSCHDVTAVVMNVQWTCFIGSRPLADIRKGTSTGDFTQPFRFYLLSLSAKTDRKITYTKKMIVKPTS